MPNLVRVHLLQAGAMMRQHLNAKSGYGVQVAAGIAFKSQLSQPAELLQRHQIIQCCKPAKSYRVQLLPDCCYLLDSVCLLERAEEHI